MSSLLSKARHFLRYKGSLTTPPCSEVVEWNVFAAPVAVAPSDIERFKESFPMNARPLQPILDESYWPLRQANDWSSAYGR
jgi:carbonic anhydrase